MLNVMHEPNSEWGMGGNGGEQLRMVMVLVVMYACLRKTRHESGRGSTCSLKNIIMDSQDAC